MTEEREFPATLEGHAAALAFLDSICINPRVSVVFDEIGSNVIRCSGSDVMRVRLAREGDDLVLTISDRGKPFDPTALPEPDVTLGAEEREVGGLGMFMVKKMSRSFVYRRENDMNVVTVALRS